MICDKDNTQKCGWSLGTDSGRYLAGGSAIFVLNEWVVKTDLSAIRLTYSSSATLISQHLIIGGWVITDT